MSSTRLPLPLHPYLHLPALSLTLLTSVLGATANWLILRFLYAALNPTPGTLNTSDVESAHEAHIILVSFLHNWEFWRTEGGRGGVDLVKEVREGSVCFVDGLAELFDGQQLKEAEERGSVVLKNAMLKSVEREVLRAVEMLKGEKRILLMIDGLDALMAVTGAEAEDMRDWIDGLREHIHAVVLAVAADLPLVQARNTFLEIEHAALIMGLAHQARSVMSLRGLKTGAARDVSGVVRVSRGGEGEGVEEGEWLYLVGGNGGVKVFEHLR